MIKIESDSAIVELKILGDNITASRLEASIFSDRIYIQDLIANVENGLLISIEETEFEEWYSRT